MKTLLRVLPSLLFLLFCIWELHENRKQRAIFRQEIDTIRTRIQLIKKLNEYKADTIYYDTVTPIAK